VWGNPEDVLHTWDSTSYALARTAEYANDGLLYLDEIGAGDARKIGPAIYQMLNGVSRLQGAKDGGVVASRSWRLTMISTGEVGMAQYLAEGGQTPRGGQEIRLMDVPADSGAYRTFDCIHGRKDGDVFSTELTTAARTNYGTAGRAFVAWLAEHHGEVTDWVAETQAGMLEAIEAEHPDAAPAARRATRKWGVLVAAAEMASEAGLTGWTQDEARTWVMSAWARWLDAFGTADRDNERLLEQVDGILRANEHGRFVLLPINPVDDPRAHNILGYRRYDTNNDPVFLVLPSAFKDEVIKGYELRHACRVLHEAGMLERSDTRKQYTVNAGKPVGMVYRTRTRKDEDGRNED
jgi:putative DNA primase/helicase